jgi:inhibitor of cysteine peptidase
MFTLNKIFLLVASVVMASIFTAANAASKSTDIFSDPNKTILVTDKAPQFTIVLHANPTTGYSWTVAKYNPVFIKVVKHVYQAPNTQLIGAGGVDVWTFRAKPLAFSAPHRLAINMLYVRPWEAQGESKSLMFMLVTQP